MSFASSQDGEPDQASEEILSFIEEPSAKLSGDEEPKPSSAWKILVADDDDEVHRATAFSLRGVIVDGRPLHLLHAHSAEEARAMLESSSDVAVALLDVVMETPDAGLRLVETIRGELSLANLRIVLRTGQAGYAPELEVIRRYDINDYRTKSELTQIRLLTTLTAAVRAYSQLENIVRVSKGLDAVAQATAELFRFRTTQDFARAVSARVNGILCTRVSGVVCIERQASQKDRERVLTVVHADEEYASCIGSPAVRELPQQMLRAIARCTAAKTCLFEAERFSLWFGNSARDAVAVFDVDTSLTDIECRMLTMFAASLSVGFENVDLIERLDFFAFFDPLTQLPNRTRFLTDVDEDLFVRTTNTQKVLGIADIVRFSDINDAMGHRCGDSLLVAVSKRLRAAVGASVRVARVSGDSFGLYGLDAAIDAGAIAQAFCAPFFIHGHALSVQLRLGVVRVAEGKHSAVDLLRDANLALNQARKAGGPASAVHSVALSDDARSRVALLHALRAAIDFKRGLSVHYQPIVDANTGRAVAAEALIRWCNDFGETVPPERFIPLAESTGMINELGLWVMETALDKLAVWRNMGYRDIGISINVSPVQIRAEDFAERVRSIIAYADVLASCVTLEITESVGLENRDRLLSHFGILTEMGVKIAIDDFGTGFSSLSQLISLPADTIKIDRRFVQTLGTSAGERAVTKTIVQLASDRGLRVVAEGVETAEQVRILAEMGCYVMQGFHFGRPMNAEQIDFWLREFSPL